MFPCPFDNKISSLQRNYNCIREDINQELFKVIAERESMYRHLETIEKENQVTTVLHHFVYYSFIFNFFS